MKLAQFKRLRIGDTFRHDGIVMRKTSALQYLPARDGVMLRAPNAEGCHNGTTYHVDTDLEVERYAT